MPGSLVGRVLAGYGDVRAAFRAELGRVSEARLMFFAMLGGGLLFLARLPSLARIVPAGIAPADFLGAQFVAHLFFLPLALYGVAALAHLGARAFGGKGGWPAARLALFWALLMSLPLVLAAEAGLTLAGLRATLPGKAVATLPWLVWGWFWALCVAEAEGFSRPGLVFLGLMAIPLAMAGLLWLAALAG